MHQWQRRVCSLTEPSICMCVKWNTVGWWSVCYFQLILCCAACYAYLKCLQRWHLRLFLCTWYYFWQKEKSGFVTTAGWKKIPNECMSIFTWESIIQQRRCYGFSQHGHITRTNSFHNVKDVSHKRANVIYMSIYT